MDFIDAQHCQKIIKVHFKYYENYFEAKDSERNDLKHEEEEDFKDSVVDFKVTPFGEKNGHLGEYFLLEIILKNDKKLRLFVKKILSKPNRPDYVKLVTRKEFDFYKWLQEEQLTCSCLPKYYLSTETFIVLELLDKFQLRARDNYAKTYLDYAHLKCAVVALAQFHSTVTTSKPTPNHFLQEAMFSTQLYMPSISKGILRFLSQRDCDKEMDIFEDQLSKLLKAFENDTEKVLETCFKVISHGDLWSNNLLFAYDDDGPIDCKLIDFQMTRLAEPAHDLCTLLIHSAFYEHFGEFTELYYNELSGEVKERLSRVDFEASIKKHANFALITRIIYAAFAAATQLRKDEGATITLDALMARDNYNFLSTVCSKYKDQKVIFDNLTLALTKLKDCKITEDVVHRVVHRLEKEESEILRFQIEEKLLNIYLTSGEVLELCVEEPNLFYELNGGSNCQKCHLYLKNDLMIMEVIGDTHKLQNLRQPFGLDDVKQCLQILAELHAISFVYPHAHAQEKRKYPTKNWKDLLKELTCLFNILNIKVDWGLVLQRLDCKPMLECIQHSGFNHEFIYFPKSKFDPELDANQMETNNLKIVIPNQMFQGCVCEELLAFLYSSTTTTFRQYYTQEMLFFYYDCLVNSLKASKMCLPFTIEEFKEGCRIFEGMAVIDALLYHQRALIFEKCRVFKTPEVVDEEAIRINYDCDEVYRRNIDDVVGKFCSIFKGALENK